MRHSKFLFLVVALLMIAACGGEKATPKQQVTQEKTAAPAPAKATGQALYPPLPHDLGMRIWNEGEMLDYLFHDLPFSMSQDEQASIQTNLTYIGQGPVTEIPSNCKPMARQFYQVGGDIILEADIYYAEGCRFYIFLVDGKETYANQMSEGGINFFERIIKQAMTARQDIGKPN